MGLAFSLSIPPVFVIRVLLGFFESLFGPALTSSLSAPLQDVTNFVADKR